VREDPPDFCRNATLVVRHVIGAAVLVVTLNVPAYASPCVVPVGRPVTLKSADIDPDVFVWDARQRVIDYVGGYWHGTGDVLAHTLLAKPGTRATVIQCAAGVIHSRFLNELQDAVGLRILSGPNRGRYGWVTGEDVHLITLPPPVASGDHRS
jgi:hypothetical protein